MQQEILIAVDNSDHSVEAIDYLLSIDSMIRKPNYTIAHIHPAISAFIMEEAEHDPAAKRKLSELLQRNHDNASSLLQRFASKMREAGIEEKRLKTVSRPQLSGIAKDILDFALVGRYDALVVGRRGISKAQEMFMGSVTAQLLEHSQVTPVWVVDRKPELSKMVIAVDGSESALRAVDHVAFMLRGNQAQSVTLLHVKPKIGNYLAIDFHLPDTEADSEPNPELDDLVRQTDGRRLKHFFKAAVAKFREAGIHRDQLHIMEVDCTMNVGKTITKEMAQGRFGTVVIGRSGENRSFFFGSVSKCVLENYTEGAVWLVP
ncbi:MAG: universal stress protein [Thermodesulfobacteriota bacterium]